MPNLGADAGPAASFAWEEHLFGKNSQPEHAAGLSVSRAVVPPTPAPFEAGCPRRATRRGPAFIKNLARGSARFVGKAEYVDCALLLPVPPPLCIAFAKPAI